jgi:hypothetical protein
MGGQAAHAASPTEAGRGHWPTNSSSS